jgi:cytochrome P450
LRLVPSPSHDAEMTASSESFRDRVRLIDGGARATDVVLDVPLAELEVDPYPLYRWMRRDLPIAWVPEVGRVLVTTWALCQEAGDDEVFGPTEQPFLSVYGENVMSMSGDPHKRLRNAMNPPFRPSGVKRYEEDILRATTARLVDAIAPQGRAEVAEDLLEPISVRAIGDVLGFTDVEDATLGRWFRGYAAYLVDFGRDPAVAAHGREVKEEVGAYLERRLPELAGAPDGSALAHMLADGMPQGAARTVEDLIGSVGVLIVGGIQEPAHGVANTLLGLLGRPEQAARVAADPGTWAQRAVDEGLRWLPPFGMTEKKTTTDTTLGGLAFPAGTEVSLVMGSANRDPARWDDPETYDLDRPPQPHMTFGYGVHFCIGHYVARVLGRIMLEEMSRALPGLRLDPDHEPDVHGWANRAAYRLPLVWDA